MATAPDVLTFLLAHVVYKDPASNLYSFLGVYSRLKAQQFPSEPMSIHAYIELIGGHGIVPITMKIVDVDEELPPVFDYTLPLHFVDPLLPCHAVFSGRNRIFPAPGHYRAQLFSNGQLLKDRRLFVE